MQVTTFLSCLSIILVQVQAGTTPSPAPVPAPAPAPAPPTPLSPLGFPCPPKGFGVCAYEIPIPPPTVIHRNTYPTVYLLDATEDKQKKGTWICPKKNIDKAEPSCCGNPMNKFTIARPLWQQYCPPTKAK
ncbi:hypothetical protein MJO29_016048 [Puccinia striiformis f. sp. tritici]|uniref:Secreted protein n=1 Tax=Puccinia striiformis TaxID=27350 RepID=A0A2S4UIJ4_9BASI|nr:hypothetical protein Pst134EB_030866 [Puccinia striiformis f. sp. tritici]KAI7934785.1 hypothetical protein MJO29_016048 [Puccinia striiformis f. sp. tritici]POV97115.1 hypothetical protein PSTT_15259 [Puccinia striiformis]